MYFFKPSANQRFLPNQPDSSSFQTSRADGMQSVRKVFQQQKLSKTVINLLMKSWTPSIYKQNSPHIIRWLEL